MLRLVAAERRVWEVLRSLEGLCLKRRGAAGAADRAPLPKVETSLKRSTAL